MKTARWSYSFFFILALLSGSLPAEGQTFQKDRQVREAFRVGPNVEVQVINKYGDIHIVPWEKDSVVFEIDLRVTSSKQARVDKIFEYIDFSFKSTAYYVIAQTVFQGQGTFWNEMVDVANTVFSSGTSTRIDYTVYYPAKNDLKIENKFGNIYTTDHSGKVDIALSNGNMKARAFKGPTKLKIDFSNLTVDDLVNVNLTASYAEINIEKAGELNLDSRSSKIYINDCNKLHLTSKRDRLYLKKAGEITGDLFFSYLNLDEAGSKISLKSNYGDMKVMRIGMSFSRMDFVSQYSDITIYIDDEHLYEFDISRDDKAQVITGTGIISSKDESMKDSPKNIHTVIKAGKTGKPKVPVMLNMKSGKLFLMKS